MKLDLRGKTAKLLTLALTSVPTVASADGLEFAGAGARATARGGAYVVGSDDAMALLYNPANLAAAPGMQLHASLGLLFYGSCYDRDGTYGTSTDGINRGGANDLGDPYGTGALTTNGETGLSDGMGGTLSFDEIRDIRTPEVCNSHKVNVVPEFAYSYRFRLGDRFMGIGLGVVAPTAPGNLQFGDTIDGREGMVRTNGLVLPSPGRYMLLGQKALIAFPTVGVGVEVAENVRVGASFGWGFGSIEFRTMATPYYSEDIAQDIYSKVDISDSFIPRVSVGASAGPFRGLSFGAQFTYYGDLDASGTLTAQTLYYRDPAVLASTPTVRATRSSAPVAIATQLPWQLNTGVRYASIREDFTESPDAIGDSIDRERWNIELNAGYTWSSRLQGFDVRLSEARIPGWNSSLPATDPINQMALADYGCPIGTDDGSDGTLPACVNLNPSALAKVPLTFPAPVRHNWVNQVTLRLGGDYMVLPGRLALSAGLSYDSNGQERGYEQLDFQPYRRVGTHLGMTYRHKRWDINVAYAHHFNETRTVRYTTGCTGGSFQANDVNGDGDLQDPGEQAVCDAPPASGAAEAATDDDWGLHPLAAQPLNFSDVANSGRFRSRLDVLQIGATYHFR